MSTAFVVFHEIRHSAIGFLLGVVAVVVAVTLLIMLNLTGRASSRETEHLMRDLGFNLLILPEEADMTEYWASREIDAQMPEEYAAQITDIEGVSDDYYRAALQRRINWRGMEVPLRGVATISPSGDTQKPKPGGIEVQGGRAVIGAAVANRFNLKKGDSINILGKQLTVSESLPTRNSEKDIMIYTHLHDAGQMLNLAGKINMIHALELPDTDFAALKQRIVAALPAVRPIRLANIAQVRSETRRMVGKFGGLILAVVGLLCVGWIGLLSLINVRQRRGEIGMFRALGFAGWRIAVILLARPAVMGFAGAIIGFFVGNWLGLHYAPQVFKLTAANLRYAWDLLGPAVLGATAASIIAGLLPTTVAVRGDPSAVLTQ